MGNVLELAYHKTSSCLKALCADILRVSLPSRYRGMLWVINFGFVDSYRYLFFSMFNFIQNPMGFVLTVDCHALEMA